MPCHPSLKRFGNSDILDPHGGGSRGLLGSLRCFMVSDLLQAALDWVSFIPLALARSSARSHERVLAERHVTLPFRRCRDVSGSCSPYLCNTCRLYESNGVKVRMKKVIAVVLGFSEA
jgi:hypothetical protein